MPGMSVQANESISKTNLSLK